MLPLNSRLKKTKEIRDVFKNGRFFKEDFLILKTVKNNLNKSRFAFIVSRKISKKATARNKIKRRLRAIIEKKLKTIKTGTDNLIMVLPFPEKKKFSDIQKALNNLIKKAKLINEQ
jgi:ribonuclease P protein component